MRSREEQKFARVLVAMGWPEPDINKAIDLLRSMKKQGAQRTAEWRARRRAEEIA